MTYASALKYLFSFINYERLPFEYKRQFNLARMEFFIEKLRHPEWSVPNILVAGTKGKGSTANFLASILIANGYKTGFYSSPHLIDPRERIRLSGKMISKNEFAQTMSELKPVIERHRKKIKSLGPLTFFEVFTLIAILYFKRKNVDFGIFEIGMGGRLDASNVLRPLISIITPISFDHTEHLGITLKAIAGEKAAIIKQDGIVVSAAQKPEAKRVIVNQIRKQHATGYFYGDSFEGIMKRVSPKGSEFDFRIGPKRFSKFQTQLPGKFQIQNASLALSAAASLENRFGYSLNEVRVKKGLKSAFWPGRFEVLKRKGSTYILDGAHNGASMDELIENVSLLYKGRPIVAILGCSREKDLAAILQPLLPKISFLIATKSDNPRAQEPRVILETAVQVGYRNPAAWAPNLKKALAFAEELDSKRSIHLILGSLFLVGEGRKLLNARN